MLDPPQRFDVNDWRELLRSVRPSRELGNWSVVGINGPIDVCHLLRMRESARPYVELGDPVPTDLFILSVGEPDNRRCTKVGGLPYLGRDRPWPTSQAGEPLPFLAQFDFSASLDLVGTLPGDVLLLFGRRDLQGGVALVWEQSERKLELVTDAGVPVKGPGPVLYGTPWRCDSYPNTLADDGDSPSSIELPSGERMYSAFFLYQMVGIQIGPCPFTSMPLKLAANEKILCTLSTVFPTIGEPFPFINHAARLSTAEARRLTRNIGEVVDSDSFGLLSVIASQDGAFRWKRHKLRNCLPACRCAERE